MTADEWERAPAAAAAEPAAVETLAG